MVWYHHKGFACQRSPFFRLAVCAILSACLHGLLILDLPESRTTQASSRSGIRATLTVLGEPTRVSTSSKIGTYKLLPATSTKASVSAQQKSPDSPTPQQASEPIGVASHFPNSAYIDGRLLDQRPIALHQPELDYPAEHTKALSGTLVLQLMISEAGSVDRVETTPGDLPASFSRVAIEAFSKVRFQPGILEGHPVKSQIWIEITFEAVPLDRP